MRNSYLIPALLLCNFLTAQISAVGIGTTDPQQKLHLDNSVGTVRVESLDKDNNPYNGGNAAPTGTFPLYVDSDGVLTLKLETMTNSDGSDAIDHLSIPTSSVTLPISDADGKIDATFKSYTLTVTRQSILEVKYSVSFEVYQTSALLKINDSGARRISTYFNLNGGARKYGQTSRCYMNGNINNPAPYASTERIAATGPAYNSSTTYIQLPPGTHTLNFKAEVSSNLPSLATHVKLAIDTDSIFMRLY